MMQRVTNMEMLKLSYWSPTKDMQGVIQEIKAFLQQWARWVNIQLIRSVSSIPVVFKDLIGKYTVFSLLHVHVQ